MSLAGNTKHWLDLQCEMIDGVARGVVLMEAAKPRRRLVTVARWPEGAEVGAEVGAVAVETMKGAAPVTRPKKGGGSGVFVGCPLLIRGQPAGVIVLDLPNRPQPQQQAVLELLRWGSRWLETMDVSTQAAPAPTDDLLEPSLQACVAAEDAGQAAQAVVVLLQQRLGALRVSLGLRRRRRLRAMAVSQLQRFDPRCDLLRRLRAAMLACRDQDRALAFPAADAQREAATEALEVLSAGQGAVLTVPLRSGGRAVGALVVEWDETQDSALDKQRARSPPSPNCWDRCCGSRRRTSAV